MPTLNMAAGLVSNPTKRRKMTPISASILVIGAELYGVVLFMAVATTVIVPPFLKLLYASEVAAREEIGPPDAGGIVASADLCKIG